MNPRKHENIRRPPAEKECLEVTRTVSNRAGLLEPITNFHDRVKVVRAVRVAACEALGHIDSLEGTAAAAETAVLLDSELKPFILLRFGGAWHNVCRAIVEEFWGRWFPQERNDAGV